MVGVRDAVVLVAAFVLGVILAALANGQGVAPQIRRVDVMPETLADVLSRLPERDAREALVTECEITHTHEAVHFLNSRLSTAQARAFYLCDGDYLMLPIPKHTTLEQAAAAIPAGLRGRTFKTYMVDAQKWWNAIPLYPADEAVAYWAGAMARRELKKTARQETERFGVELLVYTRYAFEEIEKREPESYPKAALRDLLNLLVARARIICPEFDEQPYAAALKGVGGE